MIMMTGYATEELSFSDNISNLNTIGSDVSIKNDNFPSNKYKCLETSTTETIHTNLGNVFC